MFFFFFFCFYNGFHWIFYLFFLLGFIEEFFEAVGKHNLWGHPVMKALVAIGGLVGDAACDLELDGTWMQILLIVIIIVIIVVVIMLTIIMVNVIVIIIIFIMTIITICPETARLSSHFSSFLCYPFQTVVMLCISFVSLREMKAIAASSQRHRNWVSYIFPLISVSSLYSLIYQGRLTDHLYDISSKGLNCLRKSNLVLRKSELFVCKMSVQNLVTLEN